MADTDITSNLNDSDVVIIYRPLTSTSKRKAMRTTLGVLKQVILTGAAFDQSAALAAEVQARTDADTAEAAARKSADDAEVQARSNADATEAGTRKAADDAEVAARGAAVAAEAKLRADADTAEAATRKAADDAEVAARAAAIAAEAKTRGDADTAEANARLAGDAALASRVKTLEDKPPLRVEEFTGTTNASGIAAITFSPAYASTPKLQVIEAWSGDQMITGAVVPGTATKSGCSVQVMTSRATLLLSTGPFQKAGTGVSITVQAIGL